jgi:hypothetical protein
MAPTRLIEQMVDAVEALIDPADRPFAAERIYAAKPADRRWTSRRPRMSFRCWAIAGSSSCSGRAIPETCARGEGSEADGDSESEEPSEGSPLIRAARGLSRLTVAIHHTGLRRDRGGPDAAPDQKLLEKGQHVEFVGLGATTRERRDARWPPARKSARS